MELSVKHQAFADYYVELGNATEAYLKAYPNVKKEATARVNASRLLTKANINAYIESRMEEIKTERIADQQEILQLLTEIARGKATGTALVGVGQGAQNVEQVTPTLAERTKAAELLGKRYALWTDKQQVEMTAPVTIVNDLDD